MDAAALRERQVPLKQSYRTDPATALVTLRATGTMAGDDIACSVRTAQGETVAGLHPATGGDGSLACSGDMLLQALVGCAGVTMRAIATARGIPVSGEVRAEGDLDFRGTLGVAREAPVGFRQIRLIFDLDSDAPPADLDALVAATERYCVVLQTLAAAPAVSVRRTSSRSAATVDG